MSAPCSLTSRLHPRIPRRCSMVTAPADRAAGAQLPTALPTAQPRGPCRPSIGGDPLLDHLDPPAAGGTAGSSGRWPSQSVGARAGGGGGLMAGVYSELRSFV